MMEARRGMRARLAAAVALAAVAAALALAPGRASAAQTTFYVSPTGTGACTQEAPCGITSALGLASSGETVLLAGDDGNYASTEPLNVPAGVTMKGEAGQPRPVFNSTAANYGVQLGTGSKLADFELNYTNPSVSADALLAAGTIERVQIEAPDNTACAPVAETTLLDSLCWGEYGLRAQASAGSNWTLVLRNDTVVASQEALHLRAENASDLQMSAVNTIIHGVSLDIGADRSGTGTVTATLNYSNYRGVNAEEGTSVSPEGSATNQTAPPFSSTPKPVTSARPPTRRRSTPVSTKRRTGRRTSPATPGRCPASSPATRCRWRSPTSAPMSSCPWRPPAHPRSKRSQPMRPTRGLTESGSATTGRPSASRPSGRQAR